MSRPLGGLKRPDGLAGVSRHRVAYHDNAQQGQSSCPPTRSALAARDRRHGRDRGNGGLVGFGRELEVLAFLCLLAVAPLLSSGGLTRSRRSRIEGVDPAATGRLRSAPVSSGRSVDSGGTRRVSRGVARGEGAHNDAARGATARAWDAEAEGDGHAAWRLSGKSTSGYAYGGSLGRKAGASEATRAFAAASEWGTASSWDSPRLQGTRHGAGQGEGGGGRSPGDTGGTCDGGGGETSAIWEGVDIRGGDLPAYRQAPPVPAPATPFQCCQACQREPECVAWVLVKDGGVCWLKGRWAGRPESDDCCVAADFRPGAQGVMREAASGTVELAAQRRRGEGQPGKVSGDGDVTSPREAHGSGGGARMAEGGSAAAAEQQQRAREQRRAYAGGLQGSAALVQDPAPIVPGMKDRVGGSVLILVPTVARRGVDYLTKTVDSLLAEARRGDHGFDRVAVRVVSHSPAQEHPAFRKVRERPAGPSDMRRHVTLEAAVDADRRRIDPGDPAAAHIDDRHNPEDIPGPRVRQQTLDLVSVLRDVGGVGGGRDADYVMLTEDDATMCEGALADVGRGIAAARVIDPKWSMLRTSIGFIGIVIKRTDSDALAAFLEAHYTRKPPDILLVEWVHGDWPGSVRAAAAAAEGRRLFPGDAKDPTAAPLPRTHFVAVRNAFEHIGAVSSLRQTGLAHTPQCGASLSAFLWAMERFRNAARCAEIGVVPCDRAELSPRA